MYRMSKALQACEQNVFVPWNIWFMEQNANENKIDKFFAWNVSREELLIVPKSQIFIWNSCISALLLLLLLLIVTL